MSKFDFPKEIELGEKSITRFFSNYKKLSKKKFIEYLTELEENYRNGEGLISDQEFDMIVDYFDDKFEMSWKDYIRENEEETGNMEDLPYPAPSLKTVKKDKDVTKMIEKIKSEYERPYVYMDKLDGTSLIYTGDKLFTTGRTKLKGKNVSHLIKLLDLPPIDNLSGDCVRGELVITKKRFNKYRILKISQGSKNKFDNMRSTVNGIVNGKKDKLDPECLRICQFVTFKIFGSEKSKIEQLEELEENGFDVVYYEYSNKLKHKLCKTILHERKGFKEKDLESKYEIDGIVIEPNIVDIRNQDNERDPEYTFAYKEDITTLIEVIDVIWRLTSKDGYIKPIVIFKSTRHEGKNIGKSTGWNAYQIINKKIGPGAIINGTFANGVIPHIESVEKEADYLVYPNLDEDEYEWNETGVDFVLKNPEDNDEVKINNILFFFKTLDIKGIKKESITKLYESGFTTLRKIFKMDEDDMSEVFNGPIRGKKFVDLIHNGIKNIPLHLIMAATNIFGRTVGPSRLKRILEEYPDILDFKIENEDDEAKLYEKLIKIDDIGPITADRIVFNLNKFILWLEKHHQVTIKENNDVNLEDIRFDDLRGKHVVFSGQKIYKINDSGYTQLKDILEANGVIVKDSYVKSAYYLIVKDINGSQSKLKKAEKDNIEIITGDEFIRKYKIKK